MTYLGFEFELGFKLLSYSKKTLVLFITLQPSNNVHHFWIYTSNHLVWPIFRSGNEVQGISSSMEGAELAGKDNYGRKGAPYGRVYSCHKQAPVLA